MSAFLLLQAIRVYLKPRLAKFPMAIYGRDSKGCPIVSEEGEAMRPCAVHIGSMSPTINEALSAAPFILAQILEGNDDQEGLQNIRVVLRLCIVADDYEAAEKDLQNLISQIRLWLLEAPGGVIGNGHYRLMPYTQNEGKLPWERPDDQVHPFLQAHIFTQWQSLGASKIPSPAMEDYE